MSFSNINYTPNENLNFTSYQRLDRGYGNGTIHTWCDGTTVVDYDSITLVDGTRLGRSILMHSKTGFKLIANREDSRINFYDEYVSRGGCNRLGVPLTDQANENGSGYWFGGWQGWAFSQRFENGDMFIYEKPYGVGMSEVVRVELSKQYSDIYRSSNPSTIGVPENSGKYVARCGVTGYVIDFSKASLHSTDKNVWIRNEFFDIYSKNGKSDTFGVALGDKILLQRTTVTDTYSYKFTDGYIDVSFLPFGITFKGYENNLPCWQVPVDVEYYRSLATIQRLTDGSNLPLTLTWIQTYPVLNDMWKSSKDYTSQSVYVDEMITRVTREYDGLNSLFFQAVMLDGASSLQNQNKPPYIINSRISTTNLQTRLLAYSSSLKSYLGILDQIKSNPNYLNEDDRDITLLRLDYSLGRIYGEIAYIQTEISATALEAVLVGGATAVINNPLGFVDGFINRCLSLKCVETAVNSLKVWEIIPALQKIFAEPEAVSVMLSYMENVSRYKTSYVKQSDGTEVLDFVRDSQGNLIENSQYDRAKGAGAFVADTIASGVLWGGVGAAGSQIVKIVKVLYYSSQISKVAGVDVLNKLKAYLGTGYRDFLYQYGSGINKITGSVDDFARLTPEELSGAMRGVVQTGKVFDVGEYFRLRQLGQLSDDVDSWFSWGRVRSYPLKGDELIPVGQGYRNKNWIDLEAHEINQLKLQLLSKGEDIVLFKEIRKPGVGDLEGAIVRGDKLIPFEMKKTASNNPFNAIDQNIPDALSKFKTNNIGNFEGNVYFLIDDSVTFSQAELFEKLNIYFNKTYPGTLTQNLYINYKGVDISPILNGKI